MNQNIFMKLLFIFACAILFVQCLDFSSEEEFITKRENFQENTWSLERQPQEKRRRRRPQKLVKSKRQQLAKSKIQCSGNKTVFDYANHFNCHYDNACFENFFDCCPDYERQCGKQTKSIGNQHETIQSSAWECVKMGLRFNDSCVVTGPVGVWMIHQCPSTWPSDQTKSKCHNPPNRFSHPVEDYLPVVAENQFTYRNKHCAVCHGIRNYTTWNIRVKTFVTPPAEYDLDAKLRFIVDNGGELKYVGPMENQPRRYCVGEKYIGGCNETSHVKYEDCLSGPVQVVVNRYYFKNKACAVCNNHTGAIGWGFSSPCVELPQGFSIVFKVGNPDSPPTTRIVSKHCPYGTVYDENLEFCREAHITSAEDNLSNEFLVVLWLRMRSVTYNISNSQRFMKKALTENFYLMPTQISELNFHQQDRADYMVATFRLTLTPYQDLVLANQMNATNVNISSKSMEFLRLLNFRGNFNITFKNYSFPVIKLISKQLTCFDGQVLKPGEYQLDNRNGGVFENKTGKYFSLKDYSILQGGGGNITICRQLVLPGCTEGYAYVPLHRDEYVIQSNLSLYHNVTNRTFEFGTYQISESLDDINDNILDGFHSDGTDVDQSEYRVFPRNATLAICLPHQGTCNHSDTEHQLLTSNCYRILALIGFGISIIGLFLLLITYALFRELRTIPGLNLMNLCLSLLLSQSLWLFGMAQEQMTTMCTVTAILEHYLIHVSSLATSVVCYHSHIVFSQPFVVSKSSKGQRTFMKYSVIVWLGPAIFVAICFTLDKTGVHPIHYSTNCWFGIRNSTCYFFLIPIALLLFCNVFAFVRIAVNLTRHQKCSKILQKNGRQNLLVCSKLSTLVGFPWIFAFLGVFLPEVKAIGYLFVVFSCFQGFYIGIAFLCNKKVFKLYKNLWNQGEK